MVTLTLGVSVLTARSALDHPEHEGKGNNTCGCTEYMSLWPFAQARLGYWEKDGRAKDPEISRRKHRKWRYTRERLIRSGQLEQFKGTVDVPSRSGEGTEKRTINFIRLLRVQRPDSKVRSAFPGCSPHMPVCSSNLAAKVSTRSS